jgi:photosystem II stability/assembly factor-like uncharacterized protein
VTVRLRGISAVSDEVVWASGQNGTVVRSVDGGRTWEPRPIPAAAALDLRDIEARDTSTAIAMSAGPGDASRIFRTEDSGAHWTQVYVAPVAGMFLDALAFSNDAHGVAVSDAVDGAFVVLTTADGGRTWQPVPADRLPPALSQEGAFAASGTNVAVQGARHVWIGTTAGRVLRTADGGRTWTVGTTPVANGEATGIFSIAMRDATRGVVVGGNYTKEAEAVDNLAVTSDGGATWRPARGLSGFRSVVAPLAGLGARAWLAVGPGGADLSLDDGATWSPAGGDGYDALSVAPAGRTAFASGAHGRIARVSIAPARDVTPPARNR